LWKRDDELSQMRNKSHRGGLLLSRPVPQRARSRAIYAGALFVGAITVSVVPDFAWSSPETVDRLSKPIPQFP
jgi:hypothetical protein